MNSVVKILLILVLIANVACVKNVKSNIQAKTLKPNIIYILADDLGYGDLSCTGQDKFSTPNIDKLAKEGMFFTQHYSGSTVCAPSRSTLMTGLHTGHTPIRGNKEINPEGQWPLSANTKILPELLKEKGYATGVFGKWGLGYPGSDGDPLNKGFDRFYGYNCQRLGHSYYPYHLWSNDEKIILEGNAGYKREQYAPILIHDQALEFIEKNKSNPFFLYYPSIIPHAELLAPADYMKKHLGKYEPEKSFKGTDSGEMYKLGPYQSQENGHAAFAAMINLLDDQVGEIVDTIEALGLAENTIIIFTSDNGPHLEAGADPDYFDSNSIYRGYKRDLYEGGIRVPMIVSWKNTITSGSKSNHISAFWDVLPTVCDIIKIESPKHIDGISFLPELLGDEQTSHGHLYWEFTEQGGKQALRLGDWKGIRLNMTNNKGSKIELYNLKSDIEENNDVAHKFPEIIEKISNIIKEEHEYCKEFSFEFEKGL